VGFRAKMQSAPSSNQQGQRLTCACVLQILRHTAAQQTERQMSFQTLQILLSWAPTG
jgi:hypothetical protein